MDDVFTYRVGGGPRKSWAIVVTFDALPDWATLLQIEHIASYSRGSTHWVLRSSGGVAVPQSFERAVKIRNRWAKQLLPLEQLEFGRLASPEVCEQVLGAKW
jgi:hypothetical protein